MSVALSNTDAPDLTVYRFQKNRREIVKATLGEFGGRQVVSLRVWAVSHDGECPTPKGLTLRLEQLPELMAAVAALVDATEADVAA
ncbi:MAG: transcriptional coactivator p15/PC4 family protein [Gaiellaceae bacterium]